MKKLFVLFLSLVAIFGYYACSKSSPTSPTCTSTAPSADSAALIKFAGDSIPLTKDTSGLYYHIIDSGSATVKPQSYNRLVVTYVARLIPSNTTFDSAVNSTLNNAVLGDLIYGWQVGLPKIGVGGHIQLFIPSAYAWGCTGYGPVPANAPVFFDVQLIAVN
ncbi:MAG TPA: FKBP-type peptidyl-prolyl cis-trans isomerase [Puia sp.]|jgi:FKBP-type peptidyl-prolyl cis-trans isomerase FkpA|nr:FKBP-type peptidyl-prolyl cis-trans isomerase [Puia sp.]